MTTRRQIRIPRKKPAAVSPGDEIDPPTRGSAAAGPAQQESELSELAPPICCVVSARLGSAFVDDEGFGLDDCKVRRKIPGLGSLSLELTLHGDVFRALLRDVHDVFPQESLARPQF